MFQFCLKMFFSNISCLMNVKNHPRIFTARCRIHPPTQFSRISRPLIGRNKSRDLYTGLWLVEKGHTELSALNIFCYICQPKNISEKNDDVSVFCPSFEYKHVHICSSKQTTEGLIIILPNPVNSKFFLRPSSLCWQILRKILQQTSFSDIWTELAWPSIKIKRARFYEAIKWMNSCCYSGLI